MYEVEVKIQLDDPDRLRRRLKALGAKPVSEGAEEDLFFDDEDRLRRNDEALRWRRTKKGDELTYKGPRVDTKAKIRREHNIKVEGDVAAFLRGLGYEPAARLRKERTSYAMDQATVTIDHIVGLGTFAEVECVGEDPEKAKAVVNSTLVGIGLSHYAPITTSYLQLAEDAGLDLSLA